LSLAKEADAGALARRIGGFGEPAVGRHHLQITRTSKREVNAIVDWMIKFNR
jgi:hypothetical protein